MFASSSSLNVSGGSSKGGVTGGTGGILGKSSYAAAATLPYLPNSPSCEMEMVLKLEQYSHVLAKKENEASLAIFTQDLSNPGIAEICGYSNPIYSSRLDWLSPVAPVTQIDARTIDAAIALLASTFPHQSYDHQELHLPCQ